MQRFTTTYKEATFTGQSQGFVKTNSEIIVLASVIVHINRIFNLLILTWGLNIAFAKSDTDNWYSTPTELVVL